METTSALFQRAYTKLVLLFTLSALPSFSSPRAAEWYVQPAMRGSIEYDDNRRMFPDDPERGSFEEGELTERFSPALTLGMRTPALRILGGFRANVMQSSEQELDRTDLYSRLDTEYEDVLNRWDMHFDWRRDTTLTTAIVDPLESPDTPPDPGDVDDDQDLGRSDDRIPVQRNRFNIEPTYRRELTERTALDLGYHFRTTTYEDIGGESTVDGSPQNGFEDSTSHDLSSGLEFLLTPVDTLIGRLLYSRFDAESSGFDQIGVVGGGSHSFSETLQAEIVGGFKHTWFSSDDSPSEQTDNFVYNAVIEKQLPTGSVFAVLDRDVRGGSFGDETTIDQLDLRLEMEVVPERGFVSFAGRVFRIAPTDTGGEDPEPERVYFQLQPRFVWRLDPQLSIDLSYRYRFNDPEDRDSADSNAGIIGLSYTFEKRSMSR